MGGGWAKNVFIFLRADGPNACVHTFMLFFYYYLLDRLHDALRRLAHGLGGQALSCVGRSNDGCVWWIDPVEGQAGVQNQIMMIRTGVCVDRSWVGSMRVQIESMMMIYSTSRLHQKHPRQRTVGPPNAFLTSMMATCVCLFD